MYQLIRLIGRGAFVALGLTAGFQAQAASVTIDAGAACVGFTWNGTTLSCTVDTACVVSGPSTGTPGQDVVLTASCPTSTTITWSGTGTPCNSTTSNTCTTNKATAVGNVTYIATGNNSAASPAKTVNWTTASIAPSGCSLTASPTSGAVATNVTLTASCTAGTDPINVAWTGSGTGSCPTSFNVGSPAQCTMNGVSANTTWSANFSNAAGNATSPNNPRTATFTYTAGGGGNFANCPGGSETYAHTWGGASEQYSSQGFGNNIQSIRFVIPVGTTVSSTKQISLVEFSGDPPTYREMVLSTVACSFDDSTLLKNLFGYAARSWGQSPAINYRTSNGSTYFRIEPGVPVFLNIRNRNEAGANTCTSSCNTRATIRD